MSNKRILLIEDDPALAQVIIDNLTFERFQVEWVSDGSKALTAARMSPPDLVLLDLTLPGRDGLELCGVLREGGRVPIIILSARSQKADKLAGLKLGADDYVTKPFDLEELLARIGALLRRCRPTVETLTLGQVHIDLRIPRAMLGRDEMHLTHREFEVLRYLAERSEKIVHRDELLRQVWGYLDVPAASRLGGPRHRPAAAQDRGRSAPPALHPDRPRRRLLAQPERPTRGRCEPGLTPVRRSSGCFSRSQDSRRWIAGVLPRLGSAGDLAPRRSCDKLEQFGRLQLWYRVLALRPLCARCVVWMHGEDAAGGAAVSRTAGR